MQLGTRFITRQAVLDATGNCIGYELLQGFESSEPRGLGSADAGANAIRTFDASKSDIEALRGITKAFVRCTPELLTSDLRQILPPESTVLELPVCVQPDSGAIQICKELRKAGYWLALDDLAIRQDFGPFLEHTNILKIDFRNTPLSVRSDVGRKFRGVKLLLAHHVDTKPEYEEACRHGYGLFQGFFFCQPPQAVSNRKLSPSQVTSMRLLRATANEELEFSEIERIIKEDPALCFRLLQFLNSAEFCLQSGVRSIRHALALLGERGIRRWVMLTGTVAANRDKPKELLRFALLRAKLAEALAPHAKCTEYEGFLVGLFSLMPAILELDVASLLQNIDVPVTVRGALTGKEGRLTSLLQVLSCYEQGQWLECATHARGLGLDEGELGDAYVKAVQWSMSLPI